MIDQKKISKRFMSQMWQLWEEYKDEVEGSLLASSSKTDYIMFAEQFCRWVEGDFHPGANLR